jgi:large subunit ribosomal protein L3
MLKGFLGNKIGMTQLFDEQGKAVIVTVINCSDWFVTQIKTKSNDGYSAIQVGSLKKKYKEKTFSLEWLSKKKEYFAYINELKITQDQEESYSLGQVIDISKSGFQIGDRIDVSGNSIGKGFQGVMKRWNFAGGPSGHGSRFHRAPGSIGNMASQGKVVKGKKLPGHYGNQRISVRSSVVKLDKELGCLFVKGSVPGKKGALLQVKK